MKLLWTVLAPLLLLVCLPVAEASVLKRGVFEIDYPEGKEALAKHTADVLEETAREHSAYLPTGDAPIRFVLCGTIFQFSAYAGPYPQKSVSGVAVSEQGLVAVKTPDIVDGPAGFEGVLRHELLHVLLARNTDRDNLPRWFNEGICMLFSREYRWESSFQVGQMYLQGAIISYFELGIVLDYQRGEIAFGNAYAQSYAMTKFLLDRLGEEKFWALVVSLQHQSFGDALRQHYGAPPSVFYDDWRASLWKLALVFALVSGFGIFQLAALLTLLGWWRRRKQREQKFEEWDEEDELFGVDETPVEFEDDYPEPLDVFHDDEDDPDFYQPWEWEDDEPETPDQRPRGPRSGRRRRGGRPR